jgi:hypothetical protein
MPSDSNGNYALPAGYLAIGGDTILPSQHNPPLEDIMAGLTARLMRSGAGGMTGPLKAADGTAGAPSYTFGTALTAGLYKTTAGFGVSIGGVLVAEFGAGGLISGVQTVSLNDQAVTYPKIVAPSAASRLLGSNANAALTITAAANNGSGLIRLTVASTATFTTGQKKIVAGVTGTTEANGRWTITIVDATHIDLQGSIFTNAYVSGGTIGGGVDEIKIGSGLSLVGDTLAATLSPALVPNYLSGLTLSTAGSSATMSIAAGAANDTTNVSLMALAATSKTTASWAVGAGNGGLDTGSITNSAWYHFYVIQRPDTGVVDVLFSLNGSSPPNLPTNYTLYRRIGSGRTNGSGQWIAFTQFGDDFLWLAPTADIATASLGGSPTTFGVTVPTGVRVIAQISGFFQNAAAGTSLLVQSPDVTGAGPSGTTGLITARTSVASVGVAFTATIRCNTFAQIVAYADNASSTFNVSTRGWTDLRGKV